MEFHEVIEKRRSVRSYQDKPVEEDKLQRILNAARLAPSGNNLQEWKFVVVRDGAVRTALANAAQQAFIAQAPVVIAAVSLDPDRVMHCGINAGAVNCAIALEHIALAACAEGLGTCWIGRFDQDACRKILSIPFGPKIIELMTLGYTKEWPAARPRKAMEEVVSYEKFA